MITKPLPGAKLNLLNPLSRGLVGCWLFNEGAGCCVNDSSIHKNNGDLINMDAVTDWVGSPEGFALDFDGSNDRVAIPYTTDFNLTTAFTAEIRVKTADPTSQRYLFGKFDNSPDIDWAIYHEFTQWRGSISEAGTSSIIIKSSSSSVNSDWQTVGLVYDGTTLRFDIYVDGALDNSELQGGPVTSTINDNGADLWIGGVPFPLFFQGAVSYAKVWNRALSHEEMSLSAAQPYSLFLPTTFSSALMWAATSAPAVSIPVIMANYRRQRAT